jgi:hypothetical protein
MSDLKNQLIKLGYANPDLREHIRPVLDHVTRVATVRTYHHPIEAKYLKAGMRFNWETGPRLVLLNPYKDPKDPSRVLIESADPSRRANKWVMSLPADERVHLTLPPAGMVWLWDMGVDDEFIVDGKLYLILATRESRYGTQIKALDLQTDREVTFDGELPVGLP